MRDDALSLSELLYGFRYTAEAVPHAMSDAAGDLKWDASGGGCVDGGSWEDPFPDGKGDLRGAPFCIPQPCASLLSPEDLSREVYGRPLEEGEYDTYLQRLEETCGDVTVSAASYDAGLGIDEVLALDLAGWLDLVPSEVAYHFAGLPPLVSQPWVEAAARMRTTMPPSTSLPWGRSALVPVNYRVALGGALSPSPSNRKAYRGASSGSRWAAPHRGSGTRASAVPPPKVGGGPAPRKPDQPQKPVIVPAPSPFDPAGPGGETPTDGPGDKEDGGADLVQPAPVPLPGGLPLAMGGLAALAFIRRMSRRGGA